MFTDERSDAYDQETAELERWLTLQAKIVHRTDGVARDIREALEGYRLRGWPFDRAWIWAIAKVKPSREWGKLERLWGEESAIAFMRRHYEAAYERRDDASLAA